MRKLIKLRLIAWSLTLALLFGLMPIVSFAAGAADETALILNGTAATDFAGGTGAEDDPYIIETAEQLAYLASSVNDGTSYEGEFIKLANDIVLNDTSNWENWDTVAPDHAWTAIGSSTNKFKGTFDGDGFAVNGIYINISNDYQGLFGYNCGTIKNLGIEKSYIHGKDYVGGVVGRNYEGTVTSCYNIGTVSGNEFVGGVVGYNQGTVTSCYNAGTVSGNDGIGGVVGYNLWTVTSCYNAGTVSGNDEIGGVVGTNGDIVTDCYNIGTVSGDYRIGGVVGGGGKGTITNCYNIGTVSGTGSTFSYVGSVIGFNADSTVTNCYYLTGCATDGAGTPQYGIGNETKGEETADVFGRTKGLTDAEMKEQSSFTNWSFNSIWEIRFNSDYPYPTLKCFGSKIYYYRIAFRDGYEEPIYYDVLGGTVITCEAPYVRDEYDFAYYERDDGVRYYPGDGIIAEQDAVYTAVWAVKNTSANVWNGSTDTNWEGSGEENDPYRISTAEELAGLAEMVNAGNDYSGKYFILTNDILLNDGGEQFGEGFVGKNFWQPIGCGDASSLLEGGGISDGVPKKPFSGIFDGDGHTVSGLYIDNLDVYHYIDHLGDYHIYHIDPLELVQTLSAGLFGYNSGTVKNLSVEKSYIVGAIAGSIVGGNDGTVSGCYSTSVKFENGSGLIIGGVVGINAGTVADCFNCSYIYDSRTVGGVVGYNTGIVTGCKNCSYVEGSQSVGGVVGVNGGTVSDSFNIGSLFGDYFVGGIVGDNKGTITGCYNFGEVSGYCVGGVVGISVTGTITGCCNSGDVFDNYSRGSSGGIVGENGASVTDCYNIGAVSGQDIIGGVTGNNYGTVSHCYNAGTVSSGNCVGGIVGETEDRDAVIDCYYLNICDTNATNNFGSSLTDTQMKQKKSFANWNFEEIWKIEEDSGYPTLRGITSGFAGGTGTENNPYLIETAEQLTFFAQSVNAGVDYRGKFIKLVNDISLNDTSDWELWGTVNPDESIVAPANTWTPIGNYISNDDYKSFSGTFDGNGHTISGIYMNGSGNYRGLFGYIRDAVIIDLGIEKSYISGLYYVGGIVGESYYSTIINCHNSGVVSGYVNTYEIGGIVGASLYSTIINCHNSGVVNGYVNNTYSTDYDYNTEIGGIVGFCYGSTVTDCYNTGIVCGNRYVGGIVGQNVDTTVTNCYNIGNVSATDFHVGGVIGVNNGIVTNCYNAGTVSGNQMAGGVVGENNEDGFISDCYNSGVVGGDYAVGGIVGYSFDEQAVTDCYYLDTCVTNPGNTIGTALTDAQMKQESNFVNWNFDSIWEIGFDGDYPYPTFRCFGSRSYNYRITFRDRETVLSYDVVLSGTVITHDAPSSRDGYDFAYYERDDGVRYYPGVEIIAEQDAVYTAAWIKKNTSANVWDGSTDTVWEGSGTEDDPYLIGTAEELAGLAEMVNAPKGYGDGQYFKLTADIILNDNGDDLDYYTIGENLWIPIGAKSWFGGTFDGDGHTVSGIYINNSEERQGLFGGNCGTIKNLGMEKSYIHGRQVVGSLVGYNWNGSVVNCYNTGTVSGAGNFVGGIIGINEYGTVTDCYNTGIVNGMGASVAGVAGKNLGTVSGCHNTGTVSGDAAVGGVSGYNDGGIVTECYNTGDIVGKRNNIGGVVGNNNNLVTDCYNTGNVNGNYRSSSENLGGVIGYNYYGTVTGSYNSGNVNGNYIRTHSGGVVGLNSYGSVTDCHNTGNVSGGAYTGGVVGNNDRSEVSECYNFGTVNGGIDVGGIAGHNFGSISECYNAGDITAANSAGGVVGSHLRGTVSDCYNIGNVDSKLIAGGVIGANSDLVISCYNIGTVSSKDGFVGDGVVGTIGTSYADGKNTSSTVTNSYYLNTCVTEPTSIEGMGTALTDAQMKQQSSFANWDFEEVWDIEENISYPTLRSFAKSDEPEHTHTYNQQVVDANYLKSAADCENAAIYYKSCACGEKGTETFENGAALGHLYPETWEKHDELQHKRICTRCQTEVEYENHQWNSGIVTTPATADAEGVKTLTCTVCGETKTEPVGILPEQNIWKPSDTITWEYGKQSEITINFTNFSANGGKLTFTSSNESVARLKEGATNCAILLGNAGEAEITATAAATDQYSETSSVVKIIITPAPLTVTANDVAVHYGELPEYTCSADGFVHGDTMSDLSGEAAYVCAYEQYDPVGTYPVEVSGLTSGNYRITFAAGELTVEKAVEYSITLDADTLSQKVNSPKPVTASVSPVDSTAEILIEYRVGGSWTETMPDQAGEYAVRASLISSNNIAVSDITAEGVLEIKGSSVVENGDYGIEMRENEDGTMEIGDLTEEQIEKIIENVDEDNKTIVFDASSETSDSGSGALTLPSNLIEALSESENIENLSVKTGITEITMNSDVLSTVAGNFEEGSKLTIGMETVETEDLTEKQQEALTSIGNPDDIVVLDLSMTVTDYNEENVAVGSKKIHELGGDVSVRIAYDFDGSEGKILVAMFVDDNGMITYLPVIYENGFVTFTTDHFSLYAIAEIDHTEHEWDDGVVTTEPTTASTGIRTFTCKTCFETKTEIIEKLKEPEKEPEKTNPIYDDLFYLSLIEQMHSRVTPAVLDSESAAKLGEHIASAETMFGRSDVTDGEEKATLADAIASAKKLIELNKAIQNAQLDAEIKKLDDSAKAVYDAMYNAEKLAREIRLQKVTVLSSLYTEESYQSYVTACEDALDLASENTAKESEFIDARDNVIAKFNALESASEKTAAEPAEQPKEERKSEIIGQAITTYANAVAEYELLVGCTAETKAAYYSAITELKADIEHNADDAALVKDIVALKLAAANLVIEAPETCDD